MVEKSGNGIILLLLFCFQISGVVAQKDKGSLFIIGGGSRPEAMLQRIITESGIDQRGYAMILPMASAEPDSANYYAKRQFNLLGLNNVFGYKHQPDQEPSRQQLDSLLNADLIYISGGDQDRFMRAIGNTEIAEIIKQNYTRGGMIAGTSAGAAVMSDKMITGTELKHPDYYSTFRHLEQDNIELKDGLGLLPDQVIIDQHFVRRSRYNRLLTAIIEYPEIIGIGIDEATAILVNGNTAEVVGESQVIVFRNPQNSLTDRNGKLAAKGIVLDIYLNGETFSLENP